MNHLISMYFGILQAFGILAFSIAEMIIFVGLFVKEENITLFMDAFGWILFFTLFFINFALLCLFGYLSDKYDVNTRNI